MNETELKKLCIEMIQKEFPAIRITRLQCGTVRSRKYVIKLADAGWPDYIGYTNKGRAVALEAKAPGAKPRKDQKEQEDRLADMTACNCIVLRVDSVDSCRKQLAEKIGGD